MALYKRNNTGENEPPDSTPSLFNRVNNYLLLSYSITCFLIYYSVSTILYLNNMIILTIMLPGLIAFVLPLYFLTRRLSSGFMHEYRIKTPDLPTSGIILLIAASAILPVDALSSFFEQFQPVNTDYTDLLLSIKPKGFPGFVITAFSIAVAAPFSEELLFRGFIQRIFHRNMKTIFAVILSALIFGAAHFDLTLIPGITLLGIILGYIFVRTGNLFYSFSAHALYNFVSLLRLHYTPVSDIEAGTISSPSPIWVAMSILLFFLGIYLFETKIKPREI